ncbi:type II toxin-antitoxin system RelE/ParE family toxin [Candidatus Woesearchaeota archaeon]|nr:type II toxin-antitoxin system RelE/ParE family toxin [Candidatus Woesearchaeota archaeon]
MVKVIYEHSFKKNFKKIKDASIKEKVIKQVSKIKNNPQIGKPMKYSRKGTRELYIAPYRLSYLLKENLVYILDLYHKNEQRS